MGEESLWKFIVDLSVDTLKEQLLDHSMAKDNFNKSKETMPTTSAALMVAP